MIKSIAPGISGKPNISMKMSIASDFTPVDIQIEDFKRFGYIAFLVDRDDFILDLLKLRKKWKLDNGLPSRDDKKHWLGFPWKKLNTRQQLFYQKRIKPIEEILYNLNAIWEMSIEEREKLLKKYEDAERLFPPSAFNFDIRALRKKYRRPPNFDPVIANAVIFRQVNDDDYRGIEAEIKVPEFELLPYLEGEPELVIKFYPWVGAEQIRTFFIKEAPKLIKDYEQYYIGGSIFTYDKRGNIKRDRYWYWLNQNYKGHKKMGYVTISKQVAIDWLGVREAIKAYKRMLTLKI